MKLLLVSPSHKFRKKLKAIKIPQLGLHILASLTPNDVDITVVDEEIRGIDFALDFDLVGISCMTATANRGYQLSDMFRQRGSKVVLGGIHPTILPKEKSMRTKVGLWIDHRKALIVAVTDKGEEIRLIISKVEKQLGRLGGIRSTTPYESQLVPADDSRERRSTVLLNIYYNAVIGCIRDAESILIFGPGEAKGELKKRLERNKLGGRIVGIETIDRMTDRQIAAKVRRYFQENRDEKGT